MNDSIKWIGRLKVTLTDEHGEVIESSYHNLIMNGGKNLLAKFLANQKPNGITHIAVGTGTITNAQTLTSLATEVARKPITSAIVDAQDTNVVVIDCVFGQGEAVGNLREAALYSDDVMVARATINANKGIYSQLTISWEVTIY